MRRGGKSKNVEVQVQKPLAGVVRKHKEGAVILMELPADAYFAANAASVNFLTREGFEGIYVSFHRPFRSILSLLAQEGVQTKKLLFVDVATVLEGEKEEKDPQCMHIGAEMDIDELVRVIYMSLARLKSKKRFIFLDSLTTIALYKPLSETLRFAEFLMRTVRQRDVANVMLVLNVAQDLAQKKFIKDIVVHVDEVVRVGE